MILNSFNRETYQNAVADTFKNKLEIIHRSIKNNFNKSFLREKLQKLFNEKLTFRDSKLNINSFQLFCKSLNYLITLELEEQIYLGFFNVAKKNHISATNEFNLHKAIYENNLKKINDICKNER